MAKKTNEVQNGDLKSNIIVLRCVYGKGTNQKYYIQPTKNELGRYPSCVKRVDAHGDIVLTPEELQQEVAGTAYFVKENQTFVITDGKTFDLTDVKDAAEWEAIKHCEFIAPDRYAKDSKGNYLIDGTVDPKSTKPRYGVAELYVDRPGYDSQRRVSRRKLIVDASNYILNDERGYDGRLAVARVLGRNMKNQPNADIEDYLLSIAEKTPEKIIDCYTGGDLKLRIFFIEARERGVIVKKNGVYIYGDNTILGATDTAVIEWMKSPKNSKTLALIRQDTYPDMFANEETNEK
jgi:hypothetical protein